MRRNNCKTIVRRLQRSEEGRKRFGSFCISSQITVRMAVGLQTFALRYGCERRARITFGEPFRTE